ncbi:MAG TPA: helix-turn-helix transcriptional regulator [Anaeromyxobacter sp.]|nr:helix-turn-helix transcriptional regulator [Anaeromyxobacter sp.]
MTPEAAGRERLAAFGRWLVRERELRGLSRDEVGRTTKLAPGVVEALESGEEGRIPPRAYAAGYLRAYAAAVGLDADEVVLRFEEAAGPSRARASSRRAGLRPRAVAALAVAAAIAAAIVWALARS